MNEFFNKAFKLGFAGTIFLLSGLNLTLWLFFPKFQSIGFPFIFYYWFYKPCVSGRFIISHCENVGEFLWVNLVADVLIAVGCSFIIGLIFKFVWSKISKQNLKKKYVSSFRVGLPPDGR